MATYENICKLTNKKEKIWFNMISVNSFDQNNAIIGQMNCCSVSKRQGVDLCEDCNLYNDLPHN